MDGPFPNQLVQECKKWAKSNTSYNRSPDTLTVKKYAIICMESGGRSLEDCLGELSAEQLCGVFKQIVVAMSVLEKELLFEHRDLYQHLYNLTCYHCLL